MPNTEERSLNKQPMELEEGQRRKNTKKPLYKRPCCGIITAVILLLIIILIILIFTVFKAKDPTIKLISTSVSGVSPRVSFPVLRVELNISLDLQLSIHNPNYASFKYGQSASQIYYEGDEVGDVAIPPGRFGSRSTGTIHPRLTLEADKVNMSSLVRDVVDGDMDIEIRTRIPGRATMLGFIKKHVVALSTCHVTIQLPSLDVSKQECKSKTKL